MGGILTTNSSPAQPPEESSILRTGPESDFLRNRMERPARIGRVTLGVPGAVAAAAGLTIWATDGSVLGLALGAFGAVLIVLGVVQHLLYRRDLAHWPDQAHLWDDGLELLLHNGEVRGTSWEDPELVLQLIARRAPLPAQREYLLMWLMDSKVPPVELSAEGYARLRRSAVDHSLRVTQNRRGANAEATELVEIRQRSATPFQAVTNATKASRLG
jgi:hypothetical protein